MSTMCQQVSTPPPSPRKPLKSLVLLVDKTRLATKNGSFPCMRVSYDTGPIWCGGVDVGQSYLYFARKRERTA